MGFCRNWLEGTCYLLVQEFCSALFAEFLATASTHLVMPTAVSELTEKNPFSNFLWRRGPLFWLSASSQSFGLFLPPPSPPVMLFIWATIMTSISPSLSNRLQSAGSPRPSFWPGFVTSFNRQAKELTFIPIPPLTVNLWGPLIQTQKGRGNWSYLSPLKSITSDTIKWSTHYSQLGSLNAIEWF